MSVICECGDGACTERLEISTREYENVRSDPRLYVIAKGHEILGVESVVARVSREPDPRS